jgi:hypothetical protein
VLEHANYSLALRNVSRVFCYDAETEVLTEDGWKHWPDVDGSETFATVNPDDGHLEYQRATEHFVGDFDGDMYRVRSEQVDLLVTPNHRMWVKAHDTQVKSPIGCGSPARSSANASRIRRLWVGRARNLGR